MKNLIKFELRKILTKRFAVISVAAVLLLSLILSFSTLHSMYAFDGNGAEETGKAAVEIDKQIALKYEGKLTDNKVQQMMSEFKPTQDLHGMNAKYIYQNALQSSVFSHFADIDGNWNGLSVADVFGDKEIKVGYVNGWLSTSQNMAKIFIVLSLVIILLIAPVFSGEYGDIKWLAEALSNVVKNCIESTPDGGQVKISAEENAMYVKLCVIDSGTGIAEEDIPHLFERFYRGKNSGKNGAGIGLALAKAIITQQNGRIIAENIMPCGAKFTIFFDRGVA